MALFEPRPSWTIPPPADPAYLAVNAQSAQVTLKRLDLAFKTFFRRAKAGHEPGFPRFKAGSPASASRPTATARLVRAHNLIVTEELAPSNMTASAEGTTEKPGRNVKSKAGVTRAILDATPGSFLNMLSTKAEEAGCELIVLNTRTEKPSRMCLCCGTVRNKALAERVRSRQRGTRRWRWRCLQQACG